MVDVLFLAILHASCQALKDGKVCLHHHLVVLLHFGVGQNGTFLALETRFNLGFLLQTEVLL